MAAEVEVDKRVCCGCRCGWCEQRREEKKEEKKKKENNSSL